MPEQSAELHATPAARSPPAVDFADLYTVAVRRALLGARAQELSISFDCRSTAALRFEASRLERSLHRLLCGALELCPSGTLIFDAETHALHTSRALLRIRIAANAGSTSEAVAATVSKLQLADVVGDGTLPPRLRRARGRCPLTGGLVTLAHSSSAGILVEYEQSFEIADADGGRNGVRAAGALAWLIDAEAAPAATLERRLRRLGWATTSLRSTRQALRRLRAMAPQQPRPTLVVATQPHPSCASELQQLAALLPSPSLCILAAPVGSPLLATPQAVPGVDLRVAPLGPGELEQLTAALARRADPRSRSGQPVAAAPRGTPALLVVDDDEVCRRVAAGHGASLGFEIRCACDGVEAIEACERAAPAALLIDLSMPRLDGIGASERLRALQRTGALAPFPIVAVTGQDDPEARRRCLGAGIDGVLAKPLARSDLEHELRRVRAGCVTGEATVVVDRSAV